MTPHLNPLSPVLVADAGSEVLDDDGGDLVGSGGSGAPVEVAAVLVCGDEAGPVLPFAAPTR